MSGRQRRLDALERRVASVRVPPATRPVGEPLGASLVELGELLGVVQGPTWAAWRAFLAALVGLPLDADAVETFRQHTGRGAPPTAAAREAWVIAGRRAGKSRVAALVAVWLAACRDYRAVLSPGERGVVMAIARDRPQARVIMQYVKALFALPPLAVLVARRLKDAIELRSGVTIETATASFAAVRGYTLLGAVLDEVAFWPTDEGSVTPDAEVLSALRPGMATVPGALLLAVSTPYGRRGELWRAFDRHYGRAESDVLVWRAPTRAMNPTVADGVVARAYADDPIAAAAEYGAEFRRDIEAVFDPDALRAVTVPGRRELPPVAGAPYVAFCDPSGGSVDSFTLAIAHADGERAVLDVVRERRPPFNPDAVCAEFAELLQRYGIAELQGDKYGGVWPAERFQAHGLTYRPADLTKSELYAALLPVVNAGRCELLDLPRLAGQLTGLERRVARSGKDSIDHAPGGHDDVANAAAGALVTATDATARVLAALVARALRADVRPLFPEAPRQEAPGATIAARAVSREGGA